MMRELMPGMGLSMHKRKRITRKERTDIWAGYDAPGMQRCVKEGLHLGVRAPCIHGWPQGEYDAGGVIYPCCLTCGWAWFPEAFAFVQEHGLFPETPEPAETSQVETALSVNFSKHLSEAL